MATRSTMITLATAAGALTLATSSAAAQDRLKAMPGYSEFTAMAPKYQGTLKSGSVLGGGGGRGGRGGAATAGAAGVVWSVDGKGVDYTWDGKRFHFDFAKKVPMEVAADAAATPPVASGRGGRGRGGRGGEPREGSQPFAHDVAPEQLNAPEDHGDGSSPEEAEIANQQPRQAGAPAVEGDVRRRRRRGRRGGRRSRQGRNGEVPFQSNGGEVEPGLQHAVEDMDRPPAPAFEPARSYAPRPDERPAPQAAPVTPAAAEQEPPRRRSTIREPAPFGGTSAPASPPPAAPSATPVISSTAGEDNGQPKRGWWAKKLLGDK
jgi:hypothetical protein